MAGSFKSIVGEDGSFRGVLRLDNLGDALETLHQCFNLISILIEGNPELLMRACKMAGVLPPTAVPVYQEEPLTYDYDDEDDDVFEDDDDDDYDDDDDDED